MSVYVPELIELINDEEAEVRIEAMAILTDFLGSLDVATIESDYLPLVFSIMEAGIEDINIKLAEIIGKVVYMLSPMGLHLTHKEKFIEFFTNICNHKEPEMRKNGAFNLTCFNKLYRE
jgi:hypothetical protein